MKKSFANFDADLARLSERLRQPSIGAAERRRRADVVRTALADDMISQDELIAAATARKAALAAWMQMVDAVVDQVEGEKSARRDQVMATSWTAEILDEARLRREWGECLGEDGAVRLSLAPKLRTPDGFVWRSPLEAVAFEVGASGTPCVLPEGLPGETVNGFRVPGWRAAAAVVSSQRTGEDDLRAGIIRAEAEGRSALPVNPIWANRILDASVIGADAGAWVRRQSDGLGTEPEQF